MCGFILSHLIFFPLHFRVARSSCRPAPRCCVRWVTGLCRGRRSSSSGRRTEASRCGTCCKTATSPRRARTSAAPPSPASEPAASPVRQKPVCWPEAQGSDTNVSRFSPQPSSIFWPFQTVSGLYTSYRSPGPCADPPTARWEHHLPQLNETLDHKTSHKGQFF